MTCIVRWEPFGGWRLWEITVREREGQCVGRIKCIPLERRSVIAANLGWKGGLGQFHFNNPPPLWLHIKLLHMSKTEHRKSFSARFRATGGGVKHRETHTATKSFCRNPFHKPFHQNLFTSSLLKTGTSLPLRIHQSCHRSPLRVDLISDSLFHVRGECVWALPVCRINASSEPGPGSTASLYYRTLQK